MKIIKFILFFIIISSCNKDDNNNSNNNSNNVTTSSFAGKYNGQMLQTGPPPFVNYKTGNLTFEVFDLSSSKIKLLFYSNNLTAEANLNGNDFEIIPDTVEYGVTKVIIKGDGSFNNSSMTIKWIQDTYSGSTITPVEFKGTIPKM